MGGEDQLRSERGILRHLRHDPHHPGVQARLRLIPGDQAGRVRLGEHGQQAQEAQGPVGQARRRLRALWSAPLDRQLYLLVGSGREGQPPAVLPERRPHRLVHAVFEVYVVGVVGVQDGREVLPVRVQALIEAGGDGAADTGPALGVQVVVNRPAT